MSLQNLIEQIQAADTKKEVASRAQIEAIITSDLIVTVAHTETQIAIHIAAEAQAPVLEEVQTQVAELNNNLNQSQSYSDVHDIINTSSETPLAQILEAPSLNHDEF